VLLPKEELETAAAMCAAAGTWLVLDNTYEDFLYEGRSHHTVAGPNVVSVFSFSKAYGESRRSLLRFIWACESSE
jgi:aspartate/methionine/tyrosine aminotransferase